MIYKLAIAFLLFSSCQADVCVKYATPSCDSTCNKFADDNGINVMNVEKLNRYQVDCGRPLPTVKMCIEERSSFPSVCTKWHTIGELQSCFEIRMKYDLAERELEEMNFGIKCNYLIAGEKVCVSRNRKDLEPENTQ